MHGQLSNCDQWLQNVANDDDDSALIMKTISGKDRHVLINKKKVPWLGLLNAEEPTYIPDVHAAGYFVCNINNNKM